MLSPHLQHARNVDVLSRSVDKPGNLRCPYECDAVYEPALLVQQPHDAGEEEVLLIHSELQELKMALHTKQEVQNALEGQKRRMEAEFHRIQKIQNLDERQAENLRLEIINEILTLHCPQCKMPFLDFMGCFALQCSSCKIEFCAWCIEHNALDVHSHVVTCPERSADGFFHSESVFMEHHRKRRTLAIIERLRTETQAVQRRVLHRMRQEFQDLKIVISERDVSS